MTVAATKTRASTRWWVSQPSASPTGARCTLSCFMTPILDRASKGPQQSADILPSKAAIGSQERFEAVPFAEIQGNSLGTAFVTQSALDLANCARPVLRSVMIRRMKAKTRELMQSLHWGVAETLKTSSPRERSRGGQARRKIAERHRLRRRFMGPADYRVFLLSNLTLLANEHATDMPRRRRHNLAWALILVCLMLLGAYLGLIVIDLIHVARGRYAGEAWILSGVVLGSMAGGGVTNLVRGA